MTKNIFSEFFDHESEFCLKKDLVIIDDKVLDGLCTVIRVQKQKRFSWKDQSQQHDVDQYFKFFFPTECHHTFTKKSSAYFFFFPVIENSLFPHKIYPDYDSPSLYSS